MKTLTTLTTTLALLFSLYTVNLQANMLMPLPEEAYIDDIPFNTEKIFETYIDMELIENCCMADEAYIDDIPFDTYKIAQQVDQLLLPVFNLEEEPFINDIDFLN